LARTAFVAALGDAAFLADVETLAVVFMVVNPQINSAYSLYSFFVVCKHTTASLP
jgi:hypothetical protein